MRYEPDVRAVIFDQPRSTPYYLSVAEEVVCLQAAIGAYLLEMSSDERADAEPDPAMDGLVKITKDEGLSGYVMFEILGQYRPERARLAPPDVHKAMLEYIDKHVLGYSSDESPKGVYTASR
jgi:hypothetical protein